MTKTSHLISGWVAAGAVCALSPALPSSIMLAMSVGIVLGSTAPDWMEISWWSGTKRFSLIPHRTITHWTALWVIFLIVALFELDRSHGAVSYGVSGFAAGGLLHCFLDATTPMGVPMLNPFVRTRIF